MKEFYVAINNYRLFSRAFRKFLQLFSMLWK